MADKLIFKNSEKARDAITASQKKEIQRLYEEWADEIGERAKYYSHKTNASAPLSERYYKELQKQLRATSQEVSNEVYKKIKNNIYLISDTVVKDNIKWLKKFGFSEKDLSAAFSYVPDSVVRKLITGQIYESGWSLSSRIWSDNEATLKDIYRIMAKGVAENKPIYDIAKELESYVRPGARLPWNLTAKDGIRIFKKQVDYNAQRLARTLVQHGYQQSFIETTKDNPFITEYIWRSNGSRVCPLCKARDGMHYKKTELPMDHPNGMCTMEPDVEKDMAKKLADWFNSPDGTYPEIDEFAGNFGYEVGKVDMNKLKNEIEMFVGGGYSSIKDALSKSSLDYIYDNMKIINKPMYRIEDARFTYDRIDEGDIFSFQDDLRSFTRSENYSKKIIKEGIEEGFFEQPVVFETVGPVEQFNIDKFAEAYYENQYESFVGGKFEVVEIKYDQLINGIFCDVVKIRRVR